MFFPVFFPIFEYFCFEKSKFLLIAIWYLNCIVPIYAATHTLLSVHFASGVWTVLHALLCHPVWVLTSAEEGSVHDLEASPGYQLCFTSHLPQELRWRPQVCPPPCTFRIQGSSGSSPPCLILNQALSLFRLHKSRWWAISTFSSVFGPVHSFVVAQDVTCHLLLPLAHVRQPSPLPWVVKLPWITQYFLHNKNTHRLLLWLLMVSCFNA